MNTKRIVSGIIVGCAVTILLLIPNNFVIGLLLTVIALTAMNEYMNAIANICKPIRWMGYLSCIIVATIKFIPQEYLLTVLTYSIPTIILLLFANVIATDMEISFKDIAYTFFGICYIPVFIMFLTLIDGMHNGKFLLGYIFMASWGSDVFAYVIGCRFGKHKFTKVSPKKSIEGCVAGVVGATALMLIYTFVLNNYFSFSYSYISIIIAGIVLSLLGQIGDLSASVIKRFVDIKDYGTLLPGHGGMLDRIDSVLFIAPFAYMLFSII